MKDLFIEIWASIKRNKLRTLLTGFAVAWGIFMLIVLLGAGNGLLHAFTQNGEGFASNTMALYGGWTTKPYNGMEINRNIEFNDNDLRLMRSERFVEHIDDVSAILQKGPYKISFQDRRLSTYLCGCYPILSDMNKLQIIAGRFINKYDMDLQRKSIVLPAGNTKTLLNGGQDYVSMIGKTVDVNGSAYMVVGVYQEDKSSQWAYVYIPFTTMQTMFNAANYEDEIQFTFHGLETVEENLQFEKHIRAVINQAHQAAPDDEGALYIWNRFTQNQQMHKGSSIINKALWVIGIFTLLGGIVGVSNIMLITVKERTHEFGIRKAIGASPWQIMKLIVSESVAITAFFGYIGMFLGMVTCQIMDKTIGSKVIEIMGQKMHLLLNPTVGLDIAFSVTVLLVIAGTAAGLTPAIKAARIRPIEALRNE